MSLNKTYSVLCAISLVPCFTYIFGFHPVAPEVAPVRIAAPPRPRLDDTFGNLPLRFEANVGQSEKHVEFIARNSEATVWLTANEVGMAIPNAKGPALRLRLIGAARAVRGQGMTPLSTVSNYLLGNQPQQWRTNVANFAQVKYANVYPNIDVVYYGNQQRLEYDFIVQPGADPRRIELAFAGAKRLQLDAEGNLFLHTAQGKVVQQRPVIYQDVKGVRQAVAGRYELRSRGRIGFAIAAYDKSLPLIIDPILVYTAVLGSSTGNRIVVGQDGSTYVLGSAFTPVFPTSNDAFKKSGSIFVAKLNPTGTGLVYCTYFGGTKGFDIANALAVDAAGNVYLAGMAGTTDFPVSTGAFQSSFKGPGQLGNFFYGDAFVAKLNAAGTGIVYSTYLGGAYGSEIAYGLAVNAAGEAFVGGVTGSSDYPVTAGAAEPHPFLAGETAFITKMNVQGTGLVYSTLLSPTNRAVIYALALDAQENACVTGTIRFNGGFGNSQILVARLNATGTAYAFQKGISGGSSNSLGEGIAIDATGNLYVAATCRGVQTGGNQFPVTPNAAQSQSAGGSTEAGVIKVNTAGTIIYATFLGGSGDEKANSIVVDTAGNAVLIGNTTSKDFPVSSNALQAKYGGGEGPNYSQDAFLTRLNATGTAFNFSTYLGGGGFDEGNGIAVDGAGKLYLTGKSSGPETGLGPDFPLIPGSFGTASGQPLSFGAFIAMIDPAAVGGTPDLAVAVQPVGPITGTGSNSFGSGAYQVDITNQGTGVTLGATRLRIELSAPLHFLRGGGDGWTFPEQPTYFNSGPQNLSVTYDSPIKSGESVRLIFAVSTDANSVGKSVTAKITSILNGDANASNDVATDMTTLADACLSLGLTPYDYASSINQTFAGTGGTGVINVTNASACNWTAISLASWITITPGNGNGVGTGNGTVNYQVAPNPTYRERRGYVRVGGAVFLLLQTEKPTTKSVSAANYRTTGHPTFAALPLATESIVSAFGKNLAVGAQSATTLPLPTALVGTTVTVKDSYGVERLAPLFYVSPLQINYQIPPGTAAGFAQVTIKSGDGATTTEAMQIVQVQPGIFTANQAGSGAAAAIVQRVKADGTQSFESTVSYQAQTQSYQMKEIDLGPEGERVFLLLFGVGVRNVTALTELSLDSLGEGQNPYRTPLTPLYAGPQGDYVGLDQMNFELPRDWQGRGTTTLIFRYKSEETNRVQIRLK